MKIEIGAGTKPMKDESWTRIDVRNLPGIDIVADAKDLHMIESDSVEEIYAQHVIEHFGWREVKSVLQEWIRVLKRDGRMEIIVPDFHRLWKNYIDGRVFPCSEGRWKEGPVDGAFVAYVTGGGQDYPENTHKAHYPPEWYKETLEELCCDAKVILVGDSSPSPSAKIIAVKK